MTNDVSRKQAHRQNMVASLHYAERLASQIQIAAGSHTLSAIELALSAHALITLDLAAIEGVSADFEERALTLIRAASARLGYAIIPYAAATSLKHYEVVVRQKDGREFFKSLSCPEGVSLDFYIRSRFTAEARYDSHEVIREISEEEFQSRVMRSSPQHSPEAASTEPMLTRSSVPASSEEVEIVTMAQQSGLLNIYRKVVNDRLIRLGQSEAKDIGAHFLSFLRTMERSKVAQYNLDIVVREFGGHIEAFHSQGIVMIVSDGQIRQFYTNDAFKRKIRNTSKALQLSGVTLQPGSHSNGAPLMRTALGYVPDGSRIFLESLIHFGPGNPKREMRDVPLSSAK